MPEDDENGSSAGGADDALPPALAFLGDRDAFVRRYVLSLVLQPPPSRRRQPPPRRPPPPSPSPLKPRPKKK